MVFTSLWAEYQAFPRSVEKRVRDSYFESFTPERRAELRQGVHNFVATELATHYPPGGFIGYLRWAATAGKLTCPRILRDSTVEYRLGHRRALWLTRVLLAAVMIEWTIISQLWGLRGGRRKDEPDASQPAAAESSDS